MSPYYWLVVWNITFIFPYTGNNGSNWLSYFSKGLKPPTILGSEILQSTICWWWLEHDFDFSILLGMSSSQLTNLYFSEGWLNHQPIPTSYNLQQSHVIPKYLRSNRLRILLRPKAQEQPRYLAVALGLPPLHPLAEERDLAPRPSILEESRGEGNRDAVTGGAAIVCATQLRWFRNKGGSWWWYMMTIDDYWWFMFHDVSWLDIRLCLYL